MANGLMIDRGEISETRTGPLAPQPVIITVIAKVVSYVFHPLFIPVYIAAFMIRYLPSMFASFSPERKMITLLQYFMMYSFFPMVTVGLAKGLGFLDSIYLKTQKERIIPFIACGIYYFWMCYVLRHQPEYARETVQLSMAIFIASSAGLIMNIYMKVSLHAISMGIMVAFMVLLGLTQPIPFGLYISVGFLVAGVVCTSRFIASDHTNAEVYWGFLCGVISMVVGVWADGIIPT